MVKQNKNRLIAKNVNQVKRQNNIYSNSMNKKYCVIIEDEECLSHCNSEIHEYILNDLEYIVCPFCDQKIGQHSVKKEEPCCDNQELINDESIVCKNCGIVQGYQNFVEYVDFHKNKFKIRRKSVYYQKYHLINKMDTLCIKNGRQLTFIDKDKIMKIFEEIDNVLPQLKANRKRIVNINFILKKYSL